METTEDFTKKLGAMITATVLSAGISLGNDLNLFDLILSNPDPMTSTQIAEKGNFKERYVREWLYLMVSGKIVDLSNKVSADSPEKQTFSIPEHRKIVLDSKIIGPDVSFLQNMTPLFSKVKDDLISCFNLDGPAGIGYEKYTGFQGWRDSINKKRDLIHDIVENLKSMDGMIEKLEKGIDVLEVGCSTGVSTIALARRFPASRFHGFDISEIAINRAKTESQDIANLSFSVDDACDMPSDWTKRYVLVLCWDVIHDIPRSTDAMVEIRRVMTADGLVSVVEPAMSSDIRKNLNNPVSPFLYGASLFHCTPVSLHYPGGMGLGAAWGRELAERLFTEAGLRVVSVKHIVIRHHNHFTLAFQESQSAPDTDKANVS